METSIENKKGRLILMYQLLYTNSDENHTLSTNEIIDYFAEQGMGVTRKTVKDDVQILQDAGYDIVTIRKSQNEFYMASREFDLTELEILIDAISAAEFVSKKKTDIIIRKLMARSSRYQSSGLYRNVYHPQKKKQNNDSLARKISTINGAINERKVIRFRYLDNIIKDEPVYPKRNAVITCSPYALVWKSRHCYVVARPEQSDLITNYRVEQMADLEVLPVDAELPPVDFHIANYIDRDFDLNKRDSEVVVELLVDNELLHKVVDRFGEDIETRTYSDTQFTVRVTVFPDEDFFSWVFRYNGSVTILSPFVVKTKYRKMLENALK